MAGRSSGVGLRGMRERVRQIGGTLDVISGEHGTSVVAALPIGKGKRACAGQNSGHAMARHPG